MWGFGPAARPRHVKIDLMVLVDRREVGVAALTRMRRDGVLTTLTDDVAIAPDAAPLHLARAIALRPWIPRRAAASGLAALWVYGLTRETLVPALVEVVVPRGAHPDPPTGVPACGWAFTTHQAAYAHARSIAGVRIVAPADAVISALRTADLADAMTATYGALARGVVTPQELCEAVSRHRTGQEYKRALAAWTAVQEAWEGR